MKKHIAFFLCAILLLTACTKHNDDVEDTSPTANLQFESPVIGAMYNSGDSILIKGSATFTSAMHGYDVIIRKTGDTSKLFFQHFHDHGAALQFKTKWKADIGNASLQAEVVLYLDHAGNTGTQKVGFSVK